MFRTLKHKWALHKFRKQVRYCATHAPDDGETGFSACFVYSNDAEYQKLSQMIKHELREARKGYCFGAVDSSDTYTLPNRTTISVIKATFI